MTKALVVSGLLACTVMVMSFVISGESEANMNAINNAPKPVINTRDDKAAPAPGTPEKPAPGIPQIDAAAPLKTETATFALG